MPKEKLALLQGTLDLLVYRPWPAWELCMATGWLVALSKSVPTHSYSIKGRSTRRSSPLQGKLIDAEWGTSDNNRKAKYYEITASEENQLVIDRDDNFLIGCAEKSARYSDSPSEFEDLFPNPDVELSIHTTNA